MHEVAKQRYVIQDGDGDETYCTQVHDLRSESTMIGPNFTVAESGVIAFALNAVASGHQLQYFTEDADDDGNNVFEYDGPTDGVRL